MFKYTSINTYTLRNLHRNQIYFNHPQNFNDPFDTFHPIEIDDLSEPKLIELYCKSGIYQFDEKTLKKLFDKKVNKEEFFSFCKNSIEDLLPLRDKSEYEVQKIRNEFLQNLKSDLSESEELFNENLINIVKILKTKFQLSIKKNIGQIRQEIFSKIGVCCFTKNNDNLLMWSYYADSHKGICIEFDSKKEPFSKAFKVNYQDEIPKINSDLLFSETYNMESVNKFLCFKSENWEHEDELRIFHNESNKSYNYSVDSIKSIYFGLKTNSSDIEIICSILKSQNQKVKFFKMYKQDNKFGIEPKEFTYHTPKEIKSVILLNIFTNFENTFFSIEELFNVIKLNIEENNLKNYLESMTTKELLIKTEKKYKLNKY
jgi:hypothetical protein